MEIRDSSITREILLGCNEEQLEFMNEYLLHQMKGMQAYIGIELPITLRNMLMFLRRSKAFTTEFCGRCNVRE